MKDPGRDNALDRLLARTLRTTRAADASGDCPDAEQLAAWCDEALTDSERATLEPHIADCARCQAQLAAMVRMTPPAQPVSTRRMMWPQLWRWAVPAGAAATAVALWISTQPTPLPVPQRVATDAPADVLLSGSAKPQDQPAESQDELKQSDASRDRVDTPSDRTTSRGNRRPRPTQRAADAGRSPREQEQARAEPPAAAPPADARERGLAERVAVAVAAPAAGRMLQPLEIVSPDPAVQWRVMGAIIQRSSDHEKTWTTQFTTQDVQLTAGVSASPSVCWLVGRAGVVLLSTDGSTWRRLPFPEAIDLTAVKAVSATEATVTTADGRQLATSDGGVTWVGTKN